MILEWLSWQVWKLKARKAVKNGLSADCLWCNDPIVPGDSVAECCIGENTEFKLVHAGYHFSMTSRQAFCETGAVGNGYWNGMNVSHVKSLAQRAIETGRVQIG